MKILKITKENFREEIQKTVSALKAGKVIAVPTDTVPGLICDYYNKDTEKEIFRLKKRSREKILPIFVSSIKEAEKIVKISKKQRTFLERIWPGKVSCVLKKDIGGFRIPDDEFLREVLKKFGGPLLQTSANISGEKPTGGGTPSTVVDLTGDEPNILREGAVSGDELQKIWNML